jgi:peptide/nickel transport system permease protein
VSRFLVTRLLLLAGGLVVASILIFLVLRVLPGDVAQVISGVHATPQSLASIRASLGLDQPLIVQYFDWIGGIFRGDLGTSLISGAPVVNELGEKAQVTAPLAVLSLLIALVFGGTLGVLSTLGATRGMGNAINMGTQFLAAIPIVWGGMLLILLFAIGLRIFPAQGFPLDGWADPANALRSLILPALTIGIVEGAFLLRLVRSATLEAMEQPYVRTAAAQGLTRARAVLTHGLPSVALSIVSSLGLQVAGVIVGAVIVEQLFNLPGIGRMLVADVGARDLPKVQSEILSLAAIILILGVCMDIAHRLLDPRLRQDP